MEPRAQHSISNFNFLVIFSHSKLLNDKFEVFSTLSSMHYAVQIKLQTLEQEVKFIDTTYFSCETTY